MTLSWARFLGYDTISIAHKRKKMNKLDTIKIKNFYLAKDTLKRMKTQPQNGRKYLVNYIFDKGLVSRIYKEPSKFNNIKAERQINIWKDI